MADRRAVPRAGSQPQRVLCLVARPESRAARRRVELTDRIREIHARKHHANYGALRIHRELVAQGYACNRKTVEKLMCRAGIRAETCRRFRVMTTDSRHSLPIAPNRLARQFRPRRRHQAWTMDITYIETDEGWLYLAVVEDLYSRKIVGWATSERIDSELVAAALNMALQQKRPTPACRRIQTVACSTPAIASKPSSPGTASCAA